MYIDRDINEQRVLEFGILYYHGTKKSAIFKEQKIKLIQLTKFAV